MSERIYALSQILDAKDVGRLERGLVRSSWPPYRTANVERRSVPLEQVRPLARSVDTRRLDDAKALWRQVNRDGCDPYYSHFTSSPDGVHVSLPPLVENWGDEGYLVVDGMHRLVAALDSGAMSLNILVVSAMRLPVPTVQPCKWESVRLVSGKQSREEKFPGYSEERFRPFAKFLDDLRGPHLSTSALLASLQKALCLDRLPGHDEET